MITKAVYENGVLRPLEKLNLWLGEEVEIEIKDAVLRTRCIIKLDPETARAIADGDEFSVLQDRCWRMYRTVAGSSSIQIYSSTIF